jgi:hypothetical protein
MGFLVDNLGFECWIDQIESGTFVSNLIGIPETTVRTVKLKDKTSGVIELLYFISPSDNLESKHEKTPNSHGITHIALQVDSLDRRIESLSKIGYFPINPAALSQSGEAKVCYLRGPEQVLFELVELII